MRNGAVKALSALVALGAISFVHEARADNPLLGNNDGLDTHLFRPAMDSKGFFATNGSDILGHLDFSIGLVVDYGRNLLRSDAQYTNGRTNSLINNSFQGTFGFNLGLFNHIEVGLDVPIILMDGSPQYFNAGCPGGGIVGQTAGCGNGPYNAGVKGWGDSATPGASGDRARRAEPRVPRAPREVAHPARRERLRPRARPSSGRRAHRRVSPGGRRARLVLGRSSSARSASARPASSRSR